MNEEVWVLGQQLMAAAWEAAHTMGDAEAQSRRLEELLEWVQETEAQLAGFRMALLSEAELAGTPRVFDKLRDSTRHTTQRAAAEIRLAHDLTEDYPMIGQAVCDGTISLAQAEAMVDGLKKLPVRLSRKDLQRCQTLLLGEAEVLGPYELRIFATRMLELIDPDAAEEAEAIRLARDERRAQAGRGLRIRPDFHGSMRITGQLPVADGALLQAQLDSLLPPASSYPEDQYPTMEVRRADALVLLSQLMASTGELPEHGLDRPQVHITLNLETLASGLGAVGMVGDAELAQLSPGEARRLACDASVIPVVLGGASQPLDVGRTHRLVPKPLRTALTHRDQGCAFPHCTTPAPACEAHHIQPWWAGGNTTMDNTVLLCPRHHRLVEPDPQQSSTSQWQAHIEATTGLAVFIPPNYLDPSRRPRQHRRYRLKTLQPRLADTPLAGTLDADPTEPDPATDAVAPPGSQPKTVRRLNLPPPLDPKDDPWHPDYEPPPRPPTPPCPNPEASLPNWKQPDPKDDPWYPEYQRDQMSVR